MRKGLRKVLSLVMAVVLVTAFGGVNVANAGGTTQNGCYPHGNFKSAAKSSYTYYGSHTFQRKVLLTATGNKYYWVTYTCDVTYTEATMELYCGKCFTILSTYQDEGEEHSACKLPWEPAPPTCG